MDKAEVVEVTDALGAGLSRRKVEACHAWFIHAAVTILAFTGIAKVWSAFGRTKLLGVDDPITGIQFGHLILTVGILELVIAGICLFGKSQRLPLGLIAWLATNFVVYRLGLWWMGWKKPCNCLGNLTDALHISPQLADNIMKVILVYLLIGSYGLLFWQWRKGRAEIGKAESGNLVSAETHP